MSVFLYDSNNNKQNNIVVMTIPMTNTMLTAPLFLSFLS